MANFDTTLPFGKRRALTSTFFTMAALIAAPRVGWAQGAPATPNYDSGKALRDAQPPPPPSATPSVPTPPELTDKSEQGAQAPLPSPDDERILIRDFRIEGAEFIEEAELQAPLAPYKGRSLTLAEIEEAAGKITALYRSRGFAVARTLVPRQDASNGTLVLQVLVGRYGTFSLNNRSLVVDALLNPVFAPLDSRPWPVTEAELERRMLLIGDLPGAQLPRLVVSPGRLKGTSDFEVDVPPSPMGTAFLVGDNQGSHYTGKYRLSGGVELNSPFGIADKLSANGLATNSGGLVSGRVAYSFPLYTNGLRGEVAVGQTTYELGGVYKDLAATGTGRSAEATVTYPLIRERQRNLWLSLGGTVRHLRDEIGAMDQSTARLASVGNVSARYEQWATVLGRPLYLTASAGPSFGHLSFEDAEQRALNRAGADTVGNFVYAKASGSGQLEFATNWVLGITVSGQKAINKNLDPSEQMNVAGPSGVRAYRSVVSGDNGYLLTGQIRYALWVPSVLAGKLTHSLGVFADLGGVHLEHDEYSNVKGARAQDVGAGYAARFKSLFGSLQVAQALGTTPAAAQIDDRTRLLAQIGINM